MSTVPDDIETLLSDVQKSIRDNRLFLKSLKNEEDTGVESDVETSEGAPLEEDYEEL